MAASISSMTTFTNSITAFTSSMMRSRRHHVYTHQQHASRCSDMVLNLPWTGGGGGDGWAAPLSCCQHLSSDRWENDRQHDEQHNEQHDAERVRTPISEIR